MMLDLEITSILNPSLCDSPATLDAYSKRLTGGNLTRDENPRSHFCVYFLPFNPADQKVMMVHHKKSGLWLSPGGHIDKGEGLLQALNREIAEELGVSNFYKSSPLPFLFTITPIDNHVQPCKMHYDIWYLARTAGTNFKIDPQEFHETRWLTIAEAEQLVIDPANRKALEIVKAGLKK